MEKEYRKVVFKENIVKPGHELEAFINSLFNDLYDYSEKLSLNLEKETEPLHYIVLHSKLDTVREIISNLDRLVETSTEIKEVDQNGK